jgi:hypothetical protein
MSSNLVRPSTASITIDETPFERDTLSDTSNVLSRLEPLLTSFLFRAVHDATIDVNNDTPVSHFRLNDAYRAMAGLITWESSLRKGRLPLHSDFDSLWPGEPLFTSVHDTLSSLALPRLVRRHPEIMTSVLLGVAKVAVEYITLQRRGLLSVAPINHDEDEYSLEEEDLNLEIQQDEYVSMSMDELEKLAETLSEKLAKEWGGVVQGMSMLDGLFGYNHQMLDLKVIQEMQSDEWRSSPTSITCVLFL